MKPFLVFLILLAGSGNGYAIDFTIAWDSNTESTLSGYKVYAMEADSAADFSFLKAIPLWEIDEQHPTYRLDGFQADTRYYFYLTAFDDQGNESQGSNIVCGINGKPCPEADGNPPQAVDAGYVVVSELWIKAVLHVPNNPVALVWKEIGSAAFPNGDQMVSGYFYADPAVFSHGSVYNPEVFVKVYVTAYGWCNIAFNHLTVDDVTVSSAYPYSGSADITSSVTINSRLEEHQYQGVTLQ